MPRQEIQKEPERPEFERRAAILKSIGAGFSQEDVWEGEPPNRRPRKLPLFNEIKLPLTPDEWVALCRDESDHYIGGCCGHTSGIQDSLNDWLRFSWIRCSEFADVMQSWAEHDGGEEFKNRPPVEEIEARQERLRERDSLLQALQKPGLVEPWEKLLICWWAIQGHYHPKEPEYTTIENSSKRTSAESALYDLHRLSIGLNWLTIFSDDPEHPNHQKEPNRALYLARIYPSLKTAHDLMLKVANGMAYEGWGIYDTGSKDICRNSRGLCIFDTEKSAHEMLCEWCRSDEERVHHENHIPLKGRLHIRPVKITIENGLVYTD